MRSSVAASRRRTPLPAVNAEREKRRREKRAEEGPLSPWEWHVEVWRLASGRCAVTGRAIPLLTRNTTHHPLRKTILRGRGLYGSVWDPRNGVLVLPRVHERHETGTERILRDYLPDRLWEFAEELGGWARIEIERSHPTQGGGTDG